MLHHLYKYLPWLDDGGRYSKLPLTRTSSSGVSYDLDKYEGLQESFAEKLSELWQAHRKLVIFLIALFSMLAVGVAHILQPSSAKAGWYRHPSHYRGEQIDMLSRALQPLRIQELMSQGCADLWIAKQELCQEIVEGKLIGNMAVDVAWTFVEPTEHWKAWEQAYRNKLDTPYPSEKEVLHFRSYDEIRYSIRSVLQNMPFARKMTLLATSLPVDSPPADLSTTEEQIQEVRLAQIPDWLDQKSVQLVPAAGGNATSRLEILSHWELFNGREIASRAPILPTFNSHAIESQLFRLPNPAETVLYMNNDFYIGRDISASDLSTHLFGPVFRIYPASFSIGATTLSDAMTIDGEGNARVMSNTVRLLDARFGKRGRNYLDHTACVLSGPMMAEMSRIWSQELGETASIRFRGHGPEVWLPLLSTYYTVEKHREALLWSFIVARSDHDASASFSLPERLSMFDTLAGQLDGNSLVFKTPNRKSSHESYQAIVIAGGATPPLETNYAWPSAIGYPYMNRDGGEPIFPVLDGQAGNFCKFSISECFGSGDFFDDIEGEVLSPQELFKRIAFEHPRCGDCLMGGLLSASGEKGFAAFLPLASGNATDFDTQQMVPSLGGWQEEWDSVDFSLEAALHTAAGRWNSRDFAVRLIQRYAYTFGATASSFVEMGDDVGFDGWLAWKLGEDRNPFIAINDGVTSRNQTILDGVRKVMMDWQEYMFPDPSPYEISG